MSEPAHRSANVERFTGFAALYDEQRPQPPPAVVDLLAQLAGAARPALVADVGSGTGLSTRIWAGRAEQVVGVEPSADMRAQAERRAAGLPNVRFHHGFSHATGLPDGAADIVTVSQALHWMEPEPTFAEIGRILRPGGVFAAYDCDWPPTFSWEVEQAYAACIAEISRVERQRGLSRDVRHWSKSEHLERMRSSRQFRFVKEIVLHHVEPGGAERIVGLALSQGQTATLLKSGLTEDEIGVARLRQVACATLGDAAVPFFWSYRVRLGVR